MAWGRSLTTAAPSANGRSRLTDINFLLSTPWFQETENHMARGLSMAIPLSTVPLHQVTIPMRRHYPMSHSPPVVATPRWSYPRRRLKSTTRITTTCTRATLHVIIVINPCPSPPLISFTESCLLLHLLLPLLHLHPPPTTDILLPPRNALWSEAVWPTRTYEMVTARRALRTTLPPLLPDRNGSASQVTSRRTSTSATTAGVTARANPRLPCRLPTPPGSR